MGYQEKSIKAGFKSHASDIFNGIKEINPEYAQKRAIWELLQNALDIVDEKGIIKISTTQRGLLFEHNGKHFTEENLTALIRQSSDGKEYGSNENQVGQYGTGFISTHVYGKQIYLNTTLENDENKIKKLENFLIDRSAKTIEELRDKLIFQDRLAGEICDSNNNILNEHIKFTSFEYLATDEERIAINKMLAYIPNVLPYIFAFNKKLHQVIVNGNTTYTRDITDKNYLKIKKNNSEEISLKLLSTDDEKIKIVLPYLNYNNLSEIQSLPKQFLFFPLMGTHDIGLSFISHAQEFKPNRERDFLYLENVNSEQEKDKEKNILILNTIFKLVQDEVLNNDNVDFINFLDILIKHDDSYLDKKKVELLNAIKLVERIPINIHKKTSLQSIYFIHQDILNILDSKDLEELYKLISEFYDVPSFKEYIFLSTKVNNWSLNDLQIISFKDIFNRITQKTSSNYAKISNKGSYRHTVKILSELEPNLLLENNIIPNIHNHFCKLNKLKKWDKIEGELIQVMDEINCEVSENYLHNDFCFLENTTLYTRELFKKDLNDFNGEKNKNIDSLNECTLYMVRDTLVKYISLNKTSKINEEFSQFYREEWGLEDLNVQIESPTVNISYDSAFKLLAKIYIELLQKENIKEKQERIVKFVKLLNSNHELRTNLLDKLPCFVNQNFELKPQNDLKIDSFKDEDLKNQYLEIIGKDIREELVLDSFKSFIAHKNNVTGNFVGQQIEDQLLNNAQSYLPISAQKLPILLKLIEYLSRHNNWRTWLKTLDVEKEKILMYKFENNTEISSSLFSILSSDDDQKIKLLGELAKEDDLQSLIDAGRAKQKETNRQNNHLEYINHIGLKIQSIIEERLFKVINSQTDPNLISEEQNGQDFIIYHNSSRIYYIEVKSRWMSDGIVALSKRQVECCSKNKDKYAVITVNVADYKSDNKTDAENVTFEDLENYIYVNTDLGYDFENLVKGNPVNEDEQNLRLIEYRGHIPQKRIREKGVPFNEFINQLEEKLKNHAQ